MCKKILPMSLQVLLSVSDSKKAVLTLQQLNECAKGNTACILFMVHPKNKEELFSKDRIKATRTIPGTPKQHAFPPE